MKKFSQNSTGSDPRETKGYDRPYVIAVASHKGGVGKTTISAALSWTFGQKNRRVVAVDGENQSGLTAICAKGDNDCFWKNVSLVRQLPPSMSRLSPRADLVLVDCPSIFDKEGQRIMELADGILLCINLDILMLRTLPRTLGVFHRLRERKPSTHILGIVVNQYQPRQIGLFQKINLVNDQLIISP